MNEEQSKSYAIKDVARLFRSITPLFQNCDLIVFDCGNIDVKLRETVKDLIGVYRLVYPKMGYTVVDGGDRSYLIVTKNRSWRSFEYGMPADFKGGDTPIDLTALKDLKS